MKHNTFIDEDGRKHYRGDIGWFLCPNTAKEFGWYDNGIVLDCRQTEPTKVNIESIQLTLF
jgi:hypothetical protein